MTTIAELVEQEPVATHGIATTLDADTGIWRWVIELADPSAGTDVEWFDITEAVAGVEYTRGADQPFGRYRASVANLELYADDDTFAPWNPDTSPTFGVHVELGPGLLIRGGFILVDAGDVLQWNPRWTLKVERWGDSAFALGNVRRHKVLARDTMTSLVGVPIPESAEEDWAERAQFIIDESGWPYGSEIHGDAALTVPARDAQSSAVQELDATLDPAGCIWFTDRKGRLVITNSWIDTFHSDPGLYWGDIAPVLFTYYAHTDTDGIFGWVEYATEDVEPFGIERSEEGVINHVIREAPGGTFDDDNPTSIQRFDRHTSTQSWIVENDVVAQDLLDAGAFREYEARPIMTTRDLTGFLPSAGIDLDYQWITSLDHTTQEGRIAVAVSGVCRQYVERITPRTDTDVSWELEVIVDVFTQSVTAGAVLLPVEDLALEDVTDTVAEFSWTNPTQVITPTHTQIRMLNPASLWATVDYPITGVMWGGLDPDTDYEFQVRLIRIDDGIITHFSPSRSIEFTTLETAIPDWDDDDVDFPPPDPGCTGEWELQSSPDQVNDITVEDDGEILAAPWTLADYDTSGLDPGLWYRFRWREVCSGTPGAWVYGPWFAIDCFPVSQLGVPPFDDADLIAYWPEICPPDVVNEAVSGQPVTFGNAFGGIGVDDDGLPVLLSAFEGVVAYGTDPVPVAGDSDLTLQVRVKIGAQPDEERNVLGLGGMWISVVADGAGYAVKGNAHELGAGVTTISGPTELALDTEYVLKLTHDVSAGDLILYIDDVEEVDALGSVGERFNFGLYEMLLPADSWLTDAAAWDRVLAPAFSPADIADLFAWYDASDAGTIHDTAGRVDQWDDKSGASPTRHLGSSGSARPFTGSRTMNGLNVIDFQGAQEMHKDIGTFEPKFNTNNGHFFAVCGEDAGVDYSGAVILGDTADDYNNVGGIAAISFGSSAQIGAIGYNNIDAAISGSGAAPIGTWDAWKTSTGTGIKSPSGSTGTATVSGGLNAYRILLGTRLVGGINLAYALNGPIAEVIIYSRKLTSTEEDDVRNYLIAKWGA